MKNNGIESIKV